MARSWRDRPWATYAGRPPDPPLVQGADPEHADPTPNLVPDQDDSWREQTPVQHLPSDMLGGDLAGPVVGSAVVDLTPTDHGYGLGPGPGLSADAAREINADWQERSDRGGIEARRWQPTASRDGAWLITEAPDGDATTSPETLAVRERTGIGSPHDPHARRASRIRRFRERFIDRHQWNDEKRPVYIRQAYTAPEVPAGAGPYVSPYPGNAGGFGRHGIGTPDQMVMPMVRRSPRPYGEEQTTDGTTAMDLVALPSWGL